MGAPKGSKATSDRLAWQKIFKALVQMTQTQQTQLESLAKERKLLEKRIKLQYDRWVSDVKLFQDRISQMKRDIAIQEMARLTDTAKSDLLLGLKQREAFMFKLKFEDVDEERADLKTLFDDLARICCEPKRITRSSNKGEEQQYKALESELRRLNYENKKLKVGENDQVSALSTENNFVWNQLNKMEMNLNEQMRRKCDEVASAKEKIQNLLTGMEQLESMNIEKDNTILTLKGELAKLGSESIKKSDEISRLFRELDLLRKSRSDSATPVLWRGTVESGQSRLGGKNGGADGSDVTAKKDLHGSQIIEKGSRQSKRKAAEVASTSETSKLFTSRFKVPKLKSSSPQ